MEQESLCDPLTQDDCADHRYNISSMLVKGASRKIHFTGKTKALLSPTLKYANQATPVQEDSQEYYNTGMSQKYRSQKSVFSRRDQNDPAQ